MQTERSTAAGLNSVTSVALLCAACSFAAFSSLADAQDATPIPDAAQSVDSNAVEDSPENLPAGTLRSDGGLSGAASTSSPASSTGQSVFDISDRLIEWGVPQPLPFLWDLAVAGGIFMIPIALCSVVVVAYGIERRIGLRKGYIMPRGLLVSLQKLNQDGNGIDPRLAYDVCQKYRSPLSKVIQAAILKVGRPQAELEKAVEDAVDREAGEMARNIRPINVCVSIAPLLGLIGTVQGMIMAFMVISTTTATGSAKGQELAQGIYTALVTTFAGLCVAIPAIMIANMLEGRIERLLRGMEDIFNEILPLFERFEGKWRITRKNDSNGVVLKNTSARSEASDKSKELNSDSSSGKNARSKPVVSASSAGKDKE